jgi:uncharacterized protein (TIGR02996 family)
VDEQALYRAILAEPHDDTPRLVYADWLDDHADMFPKPIAAMERGRAGFIRLQCAIARAGESAALLQRQRRLLFAHGRKWRRAFPLSIASQPFDRGFLRPRCSLRPHEFLQLFREPGMELARHWEFSSLPPDSPVRRYAPDEPFSLCPLWDIHLYGSDYDWDPLADRGQYAETLARIGSSPFLARVGWLKVSFFRTPVAPFLRTGNFANVETLVLNCGPFPEVLEAVAENESFRHLRYIHFGSDRWSWAGTQPTFSLLYLAILPKLDETNARDLPYGEMRGVLRSILSDASRLPEPPPSAMPSIPNPVAAVGTRRGFQRKAKIAHLIYLCLFWFVPMVLIYGTERGSPAQNGRAFTPEQFKLMSEWLSEQRNHREQPPVAPPPRGVPGKD